MIWNKVYYYRGNQTNYFRWNGTLRGTGNRFAIYKLKQVSKRKRNCLEGGDKLDFSVPYCSINFNEGFIIKVVAQDFSTAS